MLEQQLELILAGGDLPSRPLIAVRPAGVAAWVASLPPPQAAFLRDAGFSGAAQQLVLLPGPDGVAGAALGLGDDHSLRAFGDLAFRLPEGLPWRLAPGDFAADVAVLGYCLGAYRYTAFKDVKRAAAKLQLPPGTEFAVITAAAVGMVRDLINTPANLLGPVELAEFCAALAARYGAVSVITADSALDEHYPTVAAVGRGSARPPRVATFRWSSPNVGENAPLISLCGKGVCFDTGGYDLKPSAGMLRMKKDMGGAATVLGLARMIMEAKLPVHLVVRVGCVENSVSGTAMRPLDVLRTRRGLTVEVGNTDAEGRLVLCDMLSEASDESPALLVDCATLTGAARVALGPELPALFCNDDAWAERLVAAGREVNDPVWRLPLWARYASWLESGTADLNNVSSKPFAGSITAALFLQRFVSAGVPWAHFDLYAWNDSTTPGCPEGGEAQALRGIYSAIEGYLNAPR